MALFNRRLQSQAFSRSPTRSLAAVLLPFIIPKGPSLKRRVFDQTRSPSASVKTPDTTALRLFSRPPPPVSSSPISNTASAFSALPTSRKQVLPLPERFSRRSRTCVAASLLP